MIVPYPCSCLMNMELLVFNSPGPSTNNLPEFTVIYFIVKKSVVLISCLIIFLPIGIIKYYQYKMSIQCISG